MKLLKTLTVGLVAATAITQMASAAVTVVKISGSTAFRAPATIAIIHYLATTNNPNGSVVYGAYAANGTTGTGGTNTITSPLKAAAGVFANGTLGTSGTATIAFETSWTGSLSGVIDTATANPVPFPDESNASVQTSLAALDTTHFSGGSTLPFASASSPFPAKNGVSDGCFSDAFVTSAASALSGVTISGSITGGATTAAQLVTQINGAGLVEAGGSTVAGNHTETGFVGAVAFQWVVGNLTNTSGTQSTAPTNITEQAASYLIKNGSVPLSLLSKAGTDTFSPADFAYLIGRNEDSGTRIDAIAEPGLGFIQNPAQYLLTVPAGVANTDYPVQNDYTTIGNGTAPGTNLDLWPASSVLNTEPNLNWANVGGGHGGYISGGDVAATLSTPISASVTGSSFAGQNVGNVFTIGYLGISDSGSFGNASKVTKGQALTYNGVVASTNGVLNGSYSFWSYEHLYTKLTNANSGILDSIATSISSTYADYDGSGVAAPGTDAAGVLVPAVTTGSTSSPAAVDGLATRQNEGGLYTLGY